MLKTINTGKKEGFTAYARSVEKWLDSLHPLFFIALVTAVTFVVSLLAGVIEVVLEHALDIVVTANSSTEDILGTMGFSVFSVFMVVVAAPILETVIFQHGVIRLFNRLPISRGKRFVLILLSATAFGIAHWEPVFHIFHTFLLGLLLAYAYILKMERPREAFWIVTAIHAMRNLISSTLILDLSCDRHQEEIFAAKAFGRPFVARLRFGSYLSDSVPSACSKICA